MRELLNSKQILDLAQSLGADEAELYMENGEHLKLEAYERKLSLFQKMIMSGLALRLWKNGRVGFGCTNSSDNKVVRSVIKNILDNVELLNPDQYNLPVSPLPDQKLKTEAELEIYDTEFLNASSNEKIKRCMSLESSIYNKSPYVSIVRIAEYHEYIKNIILINTKGLDVEYRKTFWTAGATVIGDKNGERQMKEILAGTCRYSDFDTDALGEKAARTATLTLGGKPFKARRLPVLIEASGVKSILAKMSSGFLGDVVTRNMSMFKGMIGGKIASDCVNLINDGSYKTCIDTGPVDGVGVPTMENILIENGVLRGFMHDCNSANREGVISTGNSYRRSYAQEPEPLHTNLYLKPGKNNVEGLIKNIKEGVYLHYLIDVRAIDMLSDEFSVNGDGLWIKDGRLSHPVSGLTMSGRTSEFLKNISACCNDFNFELVEPYFGGGYVGSGSILVDDIMIGGE